MTRWLSEEGPSRDTVRIGQRVAFAGRSWWRSDRARPSLSLPGLVEKIAWGPWFAQIPAPSTVGGVGKDMADHRTGTTLLLVLAALIGMIVVVLTALPD